MNRLNVIVFSHKTLDLKKLGRFHIDEGEQKQVLENVKNASGAEELMYLSTCNRVEFTFSTTKSIDQQFLTTFFKAFRPDWTDKDIQFAISSATILRDEEALRHLFSVASSIDSLVVGEREIITQVRNAYDRSHDFGLTGDLIRLVVKKTIETAKEVYTNTQIAKKPVSVVSLAYRKLKELNVKLDARFLIIGSGVTNANMAKYLKKHGFTNFTVFNRTLENGQVLADELSGRAFPLADLKNYTEGFDVMLTCTGAAEPIITKEIYQTLVGDDTSKKIVIDLAVPNDLDAEILKAYPVKLIAVNNLQRIAKENLQEREKELDACRTIIDNNVGDFREMLKARKVELAMKDVPGKVKEIKEKAVNSVFAKDIEQLDQQSREVLEKVLSYMEKKCISVPMKMAKSILMDQASGK